MKMLDRDQLDRNGYIELFNIDIKQILTFFSEGYTVDTCELIPNKSSNNYSITLSSEYKYEAFPFHTDGAHHLIPPKWVILNYTGILESGTATLLFDSKSVSHLQENEDLLFNEIYLVSQRSNPFLTSIINTQMSKFPIFRWNELVMKRLIKRSPFNMANLLNSYHKRVSWTVGKTLIIDNWRILHAREKVVNGEELTRKIKRYNLTPIKDYASI